VDCLTDPTAEQGSTHLVTIGPDWSLETPHDLEAERVAQAFGGFCSCVELADRIIPALREGAQLFTRRTLVPVDHRARRMWLVHDPPSGCPCASMRFTTVQAAARHLRGALHLATKYAVPVARLRPLLVEVETAHGTGVPPEHRDAAELVLESRGLEDLWEAGVHPAAVREAIALIPRVTEPLPVWFYLGIAFQPVDDTLRELLAGCASAQTAAWVVWSDDARRQWSAQLTAEWLRTEVARSELEILVRRRVPVEAAEDLAAVTGRTLRQAATELAAWALADCYPKADDVALLDRLGLEVSPRPSCAAVDRAEEEVGWSVPRERRPSRSELGVMVALAGGVRPATALVVRGARTPKDVAAAVAAEGTRVEAG
jgi:hypothetical protein